MLLTLVQIGLIALYVYSFINKSNPSDKAFLTFLLIGLFLAILYFIIGFIKKIPLVQFDNNTLYFGKKTVAWKDVKVINVNLDASTMGQSQLSTTIITHFNQAFIIYNNYYRNYKEFSKTVTEKVAQQKLDITVLPKAYKQVNYIKNETYFRFNIFSSLFFFVFIFCAIGFLLLMNTSNTSALNLVLEFVFFIILPLVVFCYHVKEIEILGKELKIKHSLLPFFNKTIPLDNVYAIKLLTKGRGYNKFITIVYNDFTQISFYIDLLNSKCLKQLRIDLEYMNFIVIDHITGTEINMNANYTFNLFNKKRRKSRYKQ